MLTIIHLTDIHFSSTHKNSILRKAKLLLRSIISETRDSKHIIFCITGDIANFGISDEYYDYALPFFDEIIEGLKKEVIGVSFDFLFIPGNHDCDFSDEELMETRNDFMKILQENPERANKKNFLKNIISQTPFNDFKDAFLEMNKWELCEHVSSNPLISRVKLEIMGKTIMFNLYNSAWISTKKEIPGNLYIPITHLESLPTTLGDINISVIHHPTHWLEPNNKRNVESLMQKSSDIILSGHEHVSTNITLTDWNRRKIHYIEGSALQEHSNPESSGYNVINFDLNKNHFSIRKIEWNSKFYSCQNEKDTWTEIERELAANYVEESSLVINKQFEDFLKDIGLPLSHPRIKDLQLKDTYVYPNVSEIIYQEESETVSKPSDIPELIHNDNESHILFSGDKDSGKTALAKMLFQHYKDENYNPLYISGNEITPNIVRNIKLIIKKNINRVYKEDSYELYLQLLRDERILLVDDWHSSELNSNSKSMFISEANKYFKQIIFFSEPNDTVTNTIEMSSKDDDYRFKHYELMEFGHVKTDFFIEKWIRLGQSEILESKHLINEIDRLKFNLKPVLMKGYVPKYPLYILIVLNTIESGTPHNLDKSSNGYYFEILIKDSLATMEISNNETDKIYQYLTDFSFELLYKVNNSITEEEWREFHYSHLEFYDMNKEQLNFLELTSKFKKEKVVRDNDSTFEFYYPYVFYFFVAQYFARNINRIEIKEQVVKLCDDLHISENANIIMFLTHLSKDEYIMNEVINTAEKIFDNIQPLRLQDDVSIINELSELVQPLILNDINVRENRRQINEMLDEIELDNIKDGKEQAAATVVTDDEDIETDVVMNYINMTNKGFKMMDIIGQILRNYYGSLSGQDKKELCEQHYMLGLRIAHHYINDLSNQQEVLVDYITPIIEEKGLENSERALKLARRIVYSLAGFIAYHIISKIGVTVGTPNLDRTFTKALESFPFNSVELINLFIKMEYYEQFPHTEMSKFYQKNKHNKVSIEILRTMVKRHLYLYEKSRSERQKICALVGLKMGPKLKIESSK